MRLTWRQSAGGDSLCLGARGERLPAVPPRGWPARSSLPDAARRPASVTRAAGRVVQEGSRSSSWSQVSRASSRAVGVLGGQDLACRKHAEPQKLTRAAAGRVQGQALPPGPAQKHCRVAARRAPRPALQAPWWAQLDPRPVGAPAPSLQGRCWQGGAWEAKSSAQPPGPARPGSAASLLSRSCRQTCRKAGALNPVLMVCCGGFP